MTTMLLHPFPRVCFQRRPQMKLHIVNTCQVRIMISDYLFTATESDMVKVADWTRQPKVMKGEVEALQRTLTV